MKASDLASVLTAQAGVVEQGKAKDALRFLSSALSQLAPSKTALAALVELNGKLVSAPEASGRAASFADLATVLHPLSSLALSGGSKAAKDAFAALSAIVEAHGAKSVMASEGLLAPVAAPPARPKRTTATPNEDVVQRHATALREARAGSDEFQLAFDALVRDLDAKRASVPDLKAIAEILQVWRAGQKTRTQFLAAISRDHETVLDTLRKANSGANAA
jgi:hypothetical protein